MQDANLDNYPFLVDSPLQLRAYHFAAEAHGTQTRRYTGEPYILHPIRVASTVSYSYRNASPQVRSTAVSAALLHDVVEDTPVTISEICGKFGKQIGKLVFFLTDVSRPDDGNREHRKMLDRWHICGAPSMAKTIKLADLIDNTASIVDHDPDFARVYMKEKALLLRVMGGGDYKLRNQCTALLDDYYIKIVRMQP